MFKWNYNRLRRWVNDMKPTDYGPIDDHVTSVLQRIEEQERQLREQRETLAERFMQRVVQHLLQPSLMSILSLSTGRILVTPCRPRI